MIRSERDYAKRGDQNQRLSNLNLNSLIGGVESKLSAARDFAILTYNFFQEIYCKYWNYKAE